MTASWRSRVFESWAASKESGTTTNSLVLVFKAESADVNFFRTTSSKNFFGRIAYSILLLGDFSGMILAPFSKSSLACPTVRSSCASTSGNLTLERGTPLKGCPSSLSSS